MASTVDQIDALFGEAYSLLWNHLSAIAPDDIWKASLIQATAHLHAAWQYYYMYFEV
ncbi:MAG: hypothetical protein ABSB40_12875 [Nitrososphaeria archaeon]|jgi:hypothetical protein